MKSNGYIDKDLIYSFIYITLNRPYGYLDEMDLEEFGVLYKAYVHTKQEELQNLVYVVTAGVAGALNGEVVELFEQETTEHSPKAKTNPKEHRQDTLESLKDTFKRD